MTKGERNKDKRGRNMKVRGSLKILSTQVGGEAHELV
jgi:hypothetical protein